jgi:LmbE family N-acetylglucosaminyl deacetylase
MSTICLERREEAKNIESAINKKEGSALKMNMKANMTTHQRQRLLGVFAHPDDESFCAGCTFASSIAQGAEVMVVSVTRGEAGQIRSAGTATRQTLGSVRERRW